MEKSDKLISSLKKEISVLTSRSGGPGGQNINKVESRVQLIFNIKESKFLSESQKELILTKYGSKLTKEGEIIIANDSSRSQLKNKELAFKKLHRLLLKAFEKPKKRVTTKPSKAGIEKRIAHKKHNSEKKKMRRL